MKVRDLLKEIGRYEMDDDVMIYTFFGWAEVKDIPNQPKSSHVMAIVPRKTLAEMEHDMKQGKE